MKRTKIKDRVLPKYTKGEEIFNMTSHIVGAVLGIVTTVLCIVMSASHNSAYGVVSSSIYGATMIILYTMSSVYHGLSPRKSTGKKVLQVLDHCTIFLLIAGSYTPIALCAFREYNPVLGWTMFGVVWAAGGIAYTIGAILYGLGRKHKYMHSIFHLFIVLGSLLHFFCILFYVV